MKSSSRLFPVRLSSAEARGDLLEDVYLIKPNNSPDKSVELAVTRLGSDSIDLNNAPPLVFFHGCYQNRQLWLGENDQSMAASLARQGFDVWIFETRGHGLSPVNDMVDRNTLIDYAQYDIPAVNAFISEVNAKPPVWLAYGEGFGALLMALAASTLAASDVCSVVGLGQPFPSGSLRRLPLAYHLAQMVQFSDSTNPEVGPEQEPKALRNQLWREQGVFGHRGRSIGVELWSRLSEFDIPIGILNDPGLGKYEPGLQKLINAGSVKTIASELDDGAIVPAHIHETLQGKVSQEKCWQAIEHWLESLGYRSDFLSAKQIAPAC